MPNMAYCHIKKLAWATCFKMSLWQKLISGIWRYESCMEDHAWHRIALSSICLASPVRLVSKLSVTMTDEAVRNFLPAFRVHRSWLISRTPQRVELPCLANHSSNSALQEALVWQRLITFDVSAPLCSYLSSLILISCLQFFFRQCGEIDWWLIPEHWLHCKMSVIVKCLLPTRLCAEMQLPVVCVQKFNFS